MVPEREIKPREFESDGIRQSLKLMYRKTVQLRDRAGSGDEGEGGNTCAVMSHSATCGIAPSPPLAPSFPPLSTLVVRVVRTQRND